MHTLFFNRQSDRATLIGCTIPNILDSSTLCAHRSRLRHIWAPCSFFYNEMSNLGQNFSFKKPIKPKICIALNIWCVHWTRQRPIKPLNGGYLNFKFETETPPAKGSQGPTRIGTSTPDQPRPKQRCGGSFNYALKQCLRVSWNGIILGATWRANHSRRPHPCSVTTTLMHWFRRWLTKNYCNLWMA